MIYCTFLLQVIGFNLALFRIKQIITMTQRHLHWPVKFLTSQRTDANLVPA